MDREKVIEMILDPGRRPPEGTAESRALQKFLDESPEHRALFEQQDALWGVLDVWESAEPSAGFDRDLYRRIEAASAHDDAVFWAWLSRPSEWFAGMRPSLAAGLAALFLLAGGIISYQPPRGADIAQRIPAGIESEYVEQIDQTLDDIEMLADFEALLLEGEGAGKS